MTKSLIVKRDNGLTAEWGDREVVDGIKRRLQVMLPNGEKLSDGQLFAAAQYAQLTGLDPFAVGFYAMPRGGITQHYAILVAWAQSKAPYSDRYMPLSAIERQEHGITSDDTIAFKCYIMRDDRANVLGTYIQAGMPFTDALDFLAAKGIGMVTKSDRTGRDGAIDPPRGWTWERVAKKRALRDALKQSHGAPTAAELQEFTRRVYDDSQEGRLEGLERQAIELTTEHSRLSPVEIKDRLTNNVTIMRGPGDSAIGEDDTSDYEAEFATHVIKTIPWYKNKQHVISTAAALGFETITEDTAELVYDELAKYAKQQADKEAE